ncbi:MAG: NUDIX hydrolase [Acidimicrobiia bacterium]
MLDIWSRLDALGPVPRPKHAKAAVLVPLYRDAGDVVRVILTKRPGHMRTHPGDVVFPGGRMEDGEAPEDTARREACEEVGLPEDAVHVVGGLTPVTTRDPRNLIVPVVARVERPETLSPDEREVELIIEPAVSDLLDDDKWSSSKWFGRTMWFYEFEEGVMWGATGFMMREFIGHLRAESDRAGL